MLAMTDRRIAPGAILPGHRAIIGTRRPPSNVVPLPQRRRPALPPRTWFRRLGPLSDVSSTKVLASTPFLASACSSWPTEWSSSASESPKRPRRVVLVVSWPANCGEWTWWLA